MSTYGKKALIWWDYHDHCDESKKRFNNTSDDIQLEILKKWYPVNIECKIYAAPQFKFYIIGYTRFQYGWRIELGLIGLLGKSNSISIKHPLDLIISTEFEKSLIRDKRLDKILKEKPL